MEDQTQSLQRREKLIELTEFFEQPHKLARIAGTTPSKQHGNNEELTGDGMQYHTLASMDDQNPSRRRGENLGELTLLPKQRVESAIPLSTSQTLAFAATVRAPSTGIAGYIQHLGGLMRAPPHEPDAAPVVRPLNSPSDRIPPIRRMAPQRGATTLPAQEDDFMNPRLAGARRYGIDGRPFIANQNHLWPMYLGRPQEVQDRMLEDLRLRPRPRDHAILPPLTRTSSSSSVQSLDGNSLSSIKLTEAAEAESVGSRSLLHEAKARSPQRSR
jgi:hypothetical protein